MTTHTAPSPLASAHDGRRTFGKCTVKGCKARAIIEADGVTVHANDFVTIVDREVTFAGKTRRLFTIDCAEHRATTAAYAETLAWKSVKATIKPEITCDASCKTSANPICKCSCGGAEHGSRFAC